MLIIQPTIDGSFTFYSNEFEQAFHSLSGAKEESQKKFVEPCLLAEKAAKNSSLHILDICYGLGYNSAAALEAIWKVNPQCHVSIVALELDETVAKEALKQGLMEIWTETIVDLLAQLAEDKVVDNDYLKAKLLIGDARATLPRDYRADAIFLDPFSPTKCPQLWTVEFISLLAKCLKSDGLLVTYSCAASVRIAMLEAGLKIGATPNVGRRSPGSVAGHKEVGLLSLSQQEKEHLLTKAAIAYRDPNLQDSKEVIEQRRQQEQQNSNLEPTSHWKKRWIATKGLKSKE